MELHPYQNLIIGTIAESIQNGRGLTFSIEIARQGGKNELSTWLELGLLEACKDMEVNIVKCAPTFQPQAMISLKRLCDHLDCEGFEYTVESGHIVRLGLARVVFLSANENANVVGNTAHLLLEVDEAQDVDPEKFGRDFRPMAAARNATTALYGTSWREDSLLQTVKRRNLELEQLDSVQRHFRFDWKKVAYYNEDYRAYVEGERTRLGEEHPIFRTQYALLPVASGGGLFSDEQLIGIAGSHFRLRSPMRDRTYVGGLDFGREGKFAADSTVLTVAEVSSGVGSAQLETRNAQRIMVVQHYCWTGLPFTLLLPKIADVAKGWGLRRLVADATGLGAPLCSTLKQSLGHRIVPFVFTTASKSELGFNLLAAAGTGRLSLYARDGTPECEEFWKQIEGAAADYKPNRTLNFYVDPSKGHDDYLMSLALTVEAANRYEPRAAVGRM